MDNVFADTRFFCDVINNPQGLLTEDAEEMLAAIVKEFGLADTIKMAETALLNSDDEDDTQEE